MRPITLLVLSACTIPAAAQHFAPVDLAAKVNMPRNDSIMANGSLFPFGSVTLGCVPFEMEGDADAGVVWAWTPYRVAGGDSGAVTSETFDINRPATRVFTLINTLWGAPGPDSYLSLTFEATGGLSHTVEFVGNEDIRDYNQNTHTNTINGTTTRQVFTVGAQRLDMQQIDLPASFAGQTLLSMTVTDSGTPGLQRCFLAGVTVQTSACPADLTGEACVDTNDFFEFLALYQAADPRADFAPGGGVNTNDFFAFLAAYQAGCL